MVALIRSALHRLWKRVPEAPEEPRDRLELPDEGLVVYAVGDVHGCHDELVRLDRAIVADGLRTPRPKIVIMLGDYVDRGPDSAHVVDYLLQDMPAGFTRICLCGNHEQMMLRFLDDPAANLEWLDLGGDATIMSYGLDIHWLMRVYRDRPAQIVRVLREAVSEGHIGFLRGLPVLVRMGDVVFAHAGVRPGVPLAMQTDHDLMWIREPFLSEGPRLPVVVIHGHSPTSRVSLVRNRLCIDTGVYSSGRLTAVRCYAKKARLLSVETR